MAGACIQLWQSPDDLSSSSDLPATPTDRLYVSAGHPSSGIGFTLGDTATDGIDVQKSEWVCIWKRHMPSPIYHMRFSPDGLLFASAGKVSETSDERRLVRLLSVVALAYAL